MADELEERIVSGSYTGASELAGLARVLLAVIEKRDEWLPRRKPTLDVAALDPFLPVSGRPDDTDSVVRRFDLIADLPSSPEMREWLKDNQAEWKDAAD